MKEDREKEYPKKTFNHKLKKMPRTKARKIKTKIRLQPARQTDWERGSASPYTTHHPVMSLSSSSFSASPAISLGFTFFGEIFGHVIVFYPTIEVVIFRLHRWCMLGCVFVVGIHPSRT